ncbi:polyisoprenoid-binding protein YceI [Silvibacterium bohemicum]|uniref:Polyisoprenoid-binding protein YceI n=1 Tax=Silvibacterium bohemicum TaxID=1577686 RepID=A0A841K355_9BACT|nr:YceI family protein [Silvibacterium bohemicum]MBB6145058.1 polyisoprenoid-binding protein YceI [Silvibacterium bohemicum]
MSKRLTRNMRFAGLLLVVSAMLTSFSHAQAPVYTITPMSSSIVFNVKSSVSITGKFDKWDSTLVFTSADISSGVLDIKIQAASVDSGSGMKNSKLKSKDFFDVQNNPLITFHSTKIVQTSPAVAGQPVHFEVDGDFTIRGVTKPEKLELIVSGYGTGTGEIKGTMAFDRKDYGINGSIPFIKIADRVEVIVNLEAKRMSGSAPKLNQ